MMPTPPNQRHTGREPSLSSDREPVQSLTGMEPALGSGPILKSQARITMAGIQYRLGNQQILRSLVATLKEGNSTEQVAAAMMLAGIGTSEAIGAIILAAK